MPQEDEATNTVAIKQVTLQEVLDYLPQMLSVYKACWLSTYPNGALGITVNDIETRFNDMDKLEAEWKRDFSLKGNNQYYLIAEEKDTIVGFCIACKYPDEDFNELLYIYIFLTTIRVKVLDLNSWKRLWDGWEVINLLSLLVQHTMKKPRLSIEDLGLNYLMKRLNQKYYLPG